MDQREGLFWTHTASKVRRTSLTFLVIFEALSFFYSHHHVANFYFPLNGTVSNLLPNWDNCVKMYLLSSRESENYIGLGTWTALRSSIGPPKYGWQTPGNRQKWSGGQVQGGLSAEEKKAYSFMRKELSPNNVFLRAGFPSEVLHIAPSRQRTRASRAILEAMLVWGELFLQQKMKKQWLQSVEVYITWGEGRVQLPRVQQFERIPGLAACCKTKNCKAESVFPVCMQESGKLPGRNRKTKCSFA